MVQKTKDKVLAVLCENILPEAYYNVTSLFSDIPFDVLNPVLEDFQRRGFISSLNSRRVAIWLVLHLSAVEFWEAGGFSAEKSFSELNKAKLELEVSKLQLEIANLQGVPLEKTERLTSIAANISTLLAAMLGK